jgi:predicted nuclease with TOPRIM domain|tara:strand:+ start:22 stop:234 length:213 start_codon:yes stop_codon:yes gene_type:complete
MSETVTDKLEKMNVAKEEIQRQLEGYAGELETRQNQIASMRQAIVRLEAEANSLIGSMNACKKLLETEDE